MNKTDKKSILCGVLACASAFFAVLTVYFYSDSVNLTNELADANASLAQAQAAAAEVDDLNDQIADLRTQLAEVAVERMQYAQEKSDIYDLTQKAYEDGYADACSDYGIDPDDIGIYDYVQPSDEPDVSPTAYITPTGKRYHLLPSCAGENAIETTIAQASDEGYTPCIKCAQ